ncbi:MAG: undecaprenyl-diphosphate phosphatase [Bacteroidales bacterium]|nr:undecaprenyl-diphosphate phosphatase [Bacteroidales bacterium]
MNWLQALLLGILQGLTEFLPVSSSGHLELGKALLNIEADNLTFTVVVHGATVCSTIVVFFQEIKQLFIGFLEFKWNTSNQYLVKILISVFPVLIVGLFFEDFVESFFTGNLVFVGSMLFITALLLALTHFAKLKKIKEIKYFDALIIGIAQAFAVLPGISRSGATIATGLMLGKGREEVARFSFLMVLVPIIGINVLDIFSGKLQHSAVGILPLIVGFVAAFFSGWLACRWMINLVKRSKLIFFAIYCLLAGLIAIIIGF